MVNFKYNRFFLTFRELMFVEKGMAEFDGEDICLFHGNDNNSLDDNVGLKEQTKIARIDHQYTILSILDNEEELWRNMNKNYRNEIKRAQKEGIVVKFFEGNDALYKKNLIDQFESTYNKMFIQKGMHNRLNRKYVEAALEKGFMTISVAIDSTDRSNLVYHAYVHDNLNTLLLYSTSLLWEDNEKGKKIGWANKALHWEDMMYFKRKGLHKYEWGGIKSPENPNGIDKFKLGFGGKIVQYDNCICANSLKGALYLAIVKARLRK